MTEALGAWEVAVTLCYVAMPFRVCVGLGGGGRFGVGGLGSGRYFGIGRGGLGSSGGSENP